MVARVCEVDLSPGRVSNLEMGYLFEELIRRFAEQSNETAGEHFTPREVVRLMVNLLLDGDDDALSERGAIRTVFDPACGTGGMLSEAESQIRAMNDDAEVYLYGQELNPESYAICLADMLVKDKRAEYIVFGNSLSADGHAGERFHYGIANPPFGVDWSKVEGEVRDEHARLGFDGRFGAGLPRKSDGQLLFLLLTVGVEQVEQLCHQRGELRRRSGCPPSRGHSRPIFPAGLGTTASGTWGSTSRFRYSSTDSVSGMFSVSRSSGSKTTSPFPSLTTGASGSRTSVRTRVTCPAKEKWGSATQAPLIGHTS